MGHTRVIRHTRAQYHTMTIAKHNRQANAADDDHLLRSALRFQAKHRNALGTMASSAKTPKSLT